MKSVKHCFVSVGEYSGELLAAQLIIELKLLRPRLKFSGITGEVLEGVGVESVAHINEFGMMGISEVLKKLGPLSVLEKRILHYIDRTGVDFAILVDFAGFNLRLAEALKTRGIHVVHYVAPKLWAWGEERANKLKESVDLVLALFPFEEEYFNKLGIPCKYVGSPHVDRTEKVFISREVLGFSDSDKIVALLPGSRKEEITRITPLYLQLTNKVRSQIPNVKFVLPLAPTVTKGDLPTQILNIPNLHIENGMSLEIMSVADVCIVASGTATLECALCGTPFMVVYKMSPLTYAFARKKLKIQWISLVNILMQEGVVKEFIQNFSFDDVAAEVKSLITDLDRRKIMQDKFSALKSTLKGSAPHTAAQEISTFMDEC